MSSRGYRDRLSQEFTGAPSIVRRTVSGAVTLDADAAEPQQLTLTGDVTLNVANPGPQGFQLYVVLIQDGTGGHAVTWGASFRNAPALAAGTANQRASAEFRWDGSAWQFTGGAAAFA